MRDFRQRTGRYGRSRRWQSGECAPSFEEARLNTAPPELAMLVHGMGRSILSMLPLTLRLRCLGVRSQFSPYSTAFQRFETIVGRLVRRLSRIEEGSYI